MVAEHLWRLCWRNNDIRTTSSLPTVEARQGLLGRGGMTNVLLTDAD